MAQHWLLLQSGPRTAADNMAVDEVLLEASSQLARPLLRFYSWTETAATFGYFQKFSDVENLTRLRPLIRRPTGGGLVSHEADWTYSLVFPSTHPWYALKAVESYRRVHEWIQDAFSRTELSTEIASVPDKEAPGQCFVGAEQFDLLWQGRKIAGAAQRRTRQGLLIQGSIQPPPTSLAKADWQKAFCDVGSSRWDAEWTPFEISPTLEERIKQTAREKYARAEYNERR